MLIWWFIFICVSPLEHIPGGQGLAFIIIEQCWGRVATSRCLLNEWVKESKIALNTQQTLYFVSSTESRGWKWSYNQTTNNAAAKFGVRLARVQLFLPKPQFLCLRNGNNDSPCLMELWEWGGKKSYKVLDTKDCCRVNSKWTFLLSLRPWQFGSMGFYWFTNISLLSSLLVELDQPENQACIG